MHFKRIKTCFRASPPASGQAPPAAYPHSFRHPIGPPTEKSKGSCISVITAMITMVIITITITIIITITITTIVTKTMMITI